MATKITYYYSLWEKGAGLLKSVKNFDKLSNLEEMIKESISVKIFFNFSFENYIDAVKQESSHGLRIDGYKGTESAKFLGNKFEWTFKELIQKLNNTKVFSFVMTSQKEIERSSPYYKKKEIDWSQTITELEQKGIVKTLETESFMATDPRKFWVSKEDPNTAVDVDCLGMDLNKIISEKVKSLWAGIQK